MPEDTSESFVGVIISIYPRGNCVDIRVISGELKTGDVLSNGCTVSKIEQSVCSGFLGYAPLFVVLEGEIPDISISENRHITVAQA